MARPSLEPQGASWRGIADQLAARMGAARASELRAIPFAPAQGASALGAVDGGSAIVLEGAGLCVGAVRASALSWRAGAREREHTTPLELRILDDALARELDARVPGLPPAEGPAALLDRLRCLREWEQAMGLARDLREGDMLALDGPLAPRDAAPQPLRDLAAVCEERRIALVGVCKSTSLVLGGRPALLEARRAARGVPEPWFTGLPSHRAQSIAVRFLRGARVFKVELLPGADPAGVLAKLAPWTRDGAYPGYPFPLALAHNRCALDEAMVEDTAHALRALLAERGVPEEDVEEVFGDFHDVLDRGL
jgi:hypothetical protein